MWFSPPKSCEGGAAAAHIHPLAFPSVSVFANDDTDVSVIELEKQQRQQRRTRWLALVQHKDADHSSSKSSAPLEKDEESRQKGLGADQTPKQKLTNKESPRSPNYAQKSPGIETKKSSESDVFTRLARAKPRRQDAAAGRVRRVYQRAPAPSRRLFNSPRPTNRTYFRKKRLSLYARQRRISLQKVKSQQSIFSSGPRTPQTLFSEDDLYVNATKEKGELTSTTTDNDAAAKRAVDPAIRLAVKVDMMQKRAVGMKRLAEKQRSQRRATPRRVMFSASKRRASPRTMLKEYQQRPPTRENISK